MEGLTYEQLKEITLLCDLADYMVRLRQEQEDMLTDYLGGKRDYAEQIIGCYDSNRAETTGCMKYTFRC